MFNRVRRIGRGAVLLLRDAAARAERERHALASRGLVSPFVRTSKGLALGLDGQAYLLGIHDWNPEWSPQRKLQVIGSEIRRRGMVNA